MSVSDPGLLRGAVGPARCPRVQCVGVKRAWRMSAPSRCAVPGSPSVPPTSSCSRSPSPPPGPLPPSDPSLQPAPGPHCTRWDSVGGQSHLHAHVHAAWASLRSLLLLFLRYFHVLTHVIVLMSGQGGASSRKPTPISWQSMLCLPFEPHALEPAPSRGARRSLPYAEVLGALVTALPAQTGPRISGARWLSWLSRSPGLTRQVPLTAARHPGSVDRTE